MCYLSSWLTTCLPSAEINDLAEYFVLDGQSANALKDICVVELYSCLLDSHDLSCFLPQSIDLQSTGANTTYQGMDEVAA